MRSPLCRAAGMGRALCFVASVMAFTSTSVPAQVNSWINPTSGNWDDASSWSLGVLPGSSQSVMITNSGWKAVAINPSTPINFPDSMTVSNLTIVGATNTENTLLLNNFGTAVPLTVSNGLTLQDGAQILNFNSGLIVQGGTITVTNSQINQDGGYIGTMNAPMYLQNAVYNLTNGLFQGGSVFIGTPVAGRFNQYGGSVIITNLGFASFSASTNANGYSLYGGTLDLPNGMMIFGEQAGVSYLQAGGTNRTTEVTIEPDYGGLNPGFTLNDGLLADNDVTLLAGMFDSISIDQNGGSHVITNRLFISGASDHGRVAIPAAYNLNAGTLSAGVIELDADEGDSLFVQSNGTASAQTLYAHSLGYFSENNTTVMLSGGTLNCSNFTTDDGGGHLNQSGGALVVSNLLNFGGSRNFGITIYGRYTFTGGTLTASNINITGDWVIGDGSANRISNPGFFSLSHTLTISNAVEQLGGFVLASNATIDLAGSASQLSFANSSGQTWAGGATLAIADWNGNPSGGGTEQLKFGTDQSGLTPAQLSQIQFQVGTNTYSAKILASGEVVPNQGSSTSGPVNSWINPASGNWDDASSWSLGVLPDSSQSVMITNSGWKAVAINPSTPTNFPDSMTVSNLTIVGATNTENTLLLNYFGTAVPLTVSNGLTLADGAQILNFNSGLVVQGGTITVTNSQINQDGGYIVTTNAPMYLQNAVYNLTNGLFQGGQVLLGEPVSASLNQYGGTAVITDLEFVGGAPLAGGKYALYGGELSLPNGLRIINQNNESSSYFQAGGTNRTTSVFLEPGAFGNGPGFTLNDGLLADNVVTLQADDFGSVTLNQNGGTHVITNALNLLGGAAATGGAPLPSTYSLSGGTLSAASIVLDGSQGNANFVQTNGITLAEEIDATGAYLYSTDIRLLGGTLTCSNLSSQHGSYIDQFGGVLTVSNALNFGGFRPTEGPTYYSQYTFLGGTLNASNINVGGFWIIGDGSTNRISNPGFFSLSHTLTISNAVEQLGHFILAGDATIDLAGSASRLSFTKSSGEIWSGAAMLLVSDWNGNPSGGGAEQLTFGTDQSGLTAAQLNQIWFGIGTNLYSAKILATGEVVPDHVVPPPLNFSKQGNTLVLNWLPGYSLLTATNISGPYANVLDTSYPDSDVTPPYTNDMTLDPQRFFRIAP